MTPRLTDTDPNIERIQIELLRKTQVWKILEMLAGLNATMRTLALSGLRQRHPDASPEKPDAILHRPDAPTGLADIFQQIARLGAIHPLNHPSRNP